MTEETTAVVNVPSAAEAVPETPAAAEAEESAEAVSLSDEEAKRAIEAILFAAGEPLKIGTLADALEKTPKETQRLVSELEQTYAERGILLIRLDDACQLVSKPAYIGFIRRALHIRMGGSLSSAGMETLAIVAYHQPVTRSFIEQIRGTDSTHSISSLLERGLIEVCGRLDVPGKPNLYRTTADFLRAFGLSSLSELPQLDL